MDHLAVPTLGQVTTSDSANNLLRPIVVSPTRPKLYNAWRRSEEAWSSTGSRHSSRPGSSTASSSRPPSQPGCEKLYCKSTNSSLSDVSVARNFQQLSVSNRRALFKTQKWSHSFDQPQMSPGRRRQSSLQQKSLDLDSGYSGSSGSWADPAPVTTTQPQPQVARVAVCSPLESVKRELNQLRESTQEQSAYCAGDDDDQTADERSASLPSFPESFLPNKEEDSLYHVLTGGAASAGGDESLDDLDEEIKMIVARGEKRNSSDGLLTFLQEHGVDAISQPHVAAESLYVRPEPVRSKNPLLCQSTSVSVPLTNPSTDNAPSRESEPAALVVAPPRTKKLLARSRTLTHSPTTKTGEFLPNHGGVTASGDPGKTHLESLISFDHMVSSPLHNSCTMVNSPISPGVMSPPSTAGHTQVESRIFQFPPSSNNTNNQQHLEVKQEDWNIVPCLQDTSTGFAAHSSPPHPTSSSQCSPMAISPSMSTLNTPRGSITSMRSQQSPMNTTEAHQMIDDPLLSYNEAFEFVSYTTVTQSAPFLSPPRSPVSSTTPSYGPTSTVASVANEPPPPPPSYEEYYGGLTGLLPTTGTAGNAGTNALPFFDAISGTTTNYASTPDPSESFNLSSDTCPETPDSSVKEEADVNSPDTGSYICLWMECHEEFDAQKALVDHISDNHMENKKGCEEFPCLWKDCSRKFKAFNAKYKLITHMRVHTKEKPYLCTYENCNRAFARSENRKIHVRSHTGQKPFSCKYAAEFNCTKKFSNSSDRAKHEQTHKDPKPYRCEVVGCTKRYTDPSSLRKHVKSHSQEEQLQYRRSKDLANLAKRSSSPTSRYSNWMPTAAPPIVNTTADDSQQHHLLTSSSTLLQTGGTLLTVEDFTASSSPGVPSPLQQQQRSAENTASQGNGSYHGLAHQQNSLDDLDNDTIPFDNVPLRYDTSGLYEIQQAWADPTVSTTTATTGGAEGGSTTDIEVKMEHY